MNDTLSFGPVSSQNHCRCWDKNLSHWLGRLNVTNNLSRVVLCHLFNLPLLLYSNLPCNKEAVTFVLVHGSGQPDELRETMEDSSYVRTLLKWCQVVGSFFVCFLYSKVWCGKNRTKNLHVFHTEMNGMQNQSFLVKEQCDMIIDQLLIFLGLE